LTEQIRQAHQLSKGRYGAPRIHAALRRVGHHHGRKRVARLMRCAGLRGRAPRCWNKTTVPDPAAAARADLIRRDFTVNAAAVNTRWCGDITYIPTWEGWLYLATVIDIASRRVVGFALTEQLRTELVTDALTNAVAARDPAPGVVRQSGATPVLEGRGRHVAQPDHPDDPTGPDATDGASHLSRLDPTGADQFDAEHQATDLVASQTARTALRA
jgi:transposase InsO family protein